MSEFEMTSRNAELPHRRWKNTFATLATCGLCWAGGESFAQAHIRIVELPPASAAPAAPDAEPTSAPTSTPDPTPALAGLASDDTCGSDAPSKSVDASDRSDDAPAVAGPVTPPGSPAPADAPEASSGEPTRLDAEQVAEADPLTNDGDPGDPRERSGAGERSGVSAAVRLAPGSPKGSPSVAPLVDAARLRPRVAAGPKPTVIHLTDGLGPSDIQIHPVVIDGQGGASSDPALSARPAESPEMARLRADIDRCLKRYSVLYENSATRSPWGMMHAFLPWGVDAQTIVGNQKVNSIGYLCWNGACRKQKLFYQKNGEIGMYVGPGVQGHAGQFLAMLAQCRIDRNYEIRIDDYRYKIRDLIEYEKRTCVPKSELTFKLIAFSHYLEPGETWNTRHHGRWNLERVLAEELAQPIVGSACGGTHRLMGVSYAMRARQTHGQPMNGHFARAETFIDDFQQYALALQNPDGSFSTDWFERRANAPDFDRKVQTTGHILEWLVYSLPEERLTDPKVVQSVRFIVDALNTNPDYEFEVGPKGHALRALVLYQRYAFDGTYGQGLIAPAALASEPEAFEPASSDIR
ncbi:MAG TPA: hypothetical protein VGN57_05010 [Pirellulaceae bacterium]|nr:hypothetical protein [Pirellulaceae bacterium]